jgi:hypothetical protein
VQCDRPQRPAEPARIASRVSARAKCEVVVFPIARREGLTRLAKPDLDLEPYSSEILRPLTAACVFRDCSLRRQSAPLERRACRTLMRQAALKWRRGLAMGDL